MRVKGFSCPLPGSFLEEAEENKEIAATTTAAITTVMII